MFAGMSNYRRRLVPGGTYFFTVRLQDPASDLLIREIDLLRHATQLCMKRFPFRIDAAVILPSVLHMIWTMPPGDAGFSMRWRMIKSTFSRHLPAPAETPANRLRRGEKGIWQRRFWEHVIRDTADFQRHMHIMAAAPVQAGLAASPADWPYASWRRRRVGLDPPDIRTIARAPSFPGPSIAANAS